MKCQAFFALLLLPLGVSPALAQQTYGPRVPVGPQASITCPANSTRITPGQNVQTIVNGKPAGTSYCFAAGTYTRQSVVPKSGDIYTGSVGTIFDGQGATDHAFYGGMIGTSGAAASNVTIQNFVLKNYWNGGPCTNVNHEGCSRGTIDNRGVTGLTKAGPNWTIKNNEITGSSADGVSANVGTKVIANNIHDNGQDGYICGAQRLEDSSTGIEFQDNIIANNNPNNKIDWGWQAGGGKCWGTIGLKMIHNESYGNWGPGLWTDTDNEGTVYDGNYVHDNRYHGIFHEVSWDATISNNRLWNNGKDTSAAECDWGGCSAVRISSSGGVNGKSIEIFDNDVKIGTNGSGITYSQQNRQDCKRYGPCLTQNVHTHNNTIDYTNRVGNGSTGAMQDVGDTAIFTSRGNSFDYDSFVGLDGKSNPFSWNNSGMSLAQFQAAGQETHQGTTPPQPPTDTVPSGAIIIVPPPCPGGFSPAGTSCQKVQP